jgi:hypothetical protein
MATGFMVKFAGRMVDAEAAIRAAIVTGDTRRVLHLAREAYGSEAAKLRTRRPEDGALTDVEMAARLLADTERLSAYKPVRSGNPREMPSTDELLAAFDRALGETRS